MEFKEFIDLFPKDYCKTKKEKILLSTLFDYIAPKESCQLAELIFDESKQNFYSRITRNDIVKVDGNYFISTYNRDFIGIKLNETNVEIYKADEYTNIIELMTISEDGKRKSEVIESDPFLLKEHIKSILLTNDTPKEILSNLKVAEVERIKNEDINLSTLSLLFPQELMKNPMYEEMVKEIFSFCWKNDAFNYTREQYESLSNFITDANDGIIELGDNGIVKIDKKNGKFALEYFAVVKDYNGKPLYRHFPDDLPLEIDMSKAHIVYRNDEKFHVLMEFIGLDCENNYLDKYTGCISEAYIEHTRTYGDKKEKTIINIDQPCQLAHISQFIHGSNIDIQSDMNDMQEFMNRKQLQ